MHCAQPPEPAAPTARSSSGGRGRHCAAESPTRPHSLWAAGGTPRGASPSAQSRFGSSTSSATSSAANPSPRDARSCLDTAACAAKLEQGAERRQKTRSKAQCTRSRLVSQSHSVRRHKKTIVLAQCGEQPMGGNRQRHRPHTLRVTV